MNEQLIQSKPSNLPDVSGDTGVIESSFRQDNLPFEDKCRSLIPVNGLTTNFQDCLLDKAEWIALQPGQTLFLLGEQDAGLFYLLSGSIDLISEQYHLEDINAGMEAARFALDQFIIAEQFFVKAKSVSVLLRLKRDLFDRLLVIEAEDEVMGLVDPAIGSVDYWLSDFLQTPLMTRLPAASMRRAFSLLETLLVRTGDQIVTDGIPCDYFHIVRKGSCQVYCFNHESGKKIELARLGSGDYFGEEMQLEGEKRCSPVKMLSSGLLLRLAKVDYNDLVNSASYQQSVSYEQASTRVKEGAVWLDVRLICEHSHNGFHDSLNIPLNRVSAELDNLVKDQQYIVYCDTGIRSLAAMALLVEEGFDAGHLEGGIRKVFRDKKMGDEWIDGFSDRLRSKAVSTTMVPFVFVSAEEESISIGEQMTEIDHRIGNLKKLFIFPQDQSEAISKDLVTDVEGQACSQARDLGGLIEVRKRMEQIDNQQATGGLLDTKVGTGESELGLLRRQLENAQHKLNLKRTKDNPVSTDSDGQVDTLEQVTKELEVIKNKLKEQESVEMKRRQSFEHQLMVERKKMSDELARFASGIELQQSRSLEIEKVKQLAMQESIQLIERFKMAHGEYRQRHARTIQRVRKQLQQQATQVLEKARRAQIEKNEAVAVLREVQKQLDDLTGQRSQENDKSGESQSVTVEVPILLDIESVGTQNDKAK